MGVRAPRTRRRCAPSSRACGRIGAIVALSIIAVAPRALAQAAPAAPPAAPSPAEERARALYLEGHEAAAAGRWSVALTKFSASYQLSHNPAALFNAAVALRGLGRHRDARDAFARLLVDHADLDDELRAQAHALRAEEAPLVAVLDIHGLDGCAVRLDELPVSSGDGVSLRIETDAGAHALSGDCPGRVTEHWTGRLRDGELLALTFQPRALPQAPPSPRPPPAPPPVPLSPWPWVMIGAGGAVLIGGGALLGLGLGERAVVADAPPGSSWRDVEGAHGRAKLLVGLGPALMGTGAASVVVGILWRVFDKHAVSPTPALASPELPLGVAF